MIILYAILSLLVCIILWISVPYSSLRKKFDKLQKEMYKSITLKNQYFSEELLNQKPYLLKKYITYCGLYNKPLMKSSYTKFKNTDFLLQDDAPMIKIKYYLVNFASGFNRLAFIDTKMYGIIPFQGLDSCINTTGQMEGVLMKLLTIFNVIGDEMDTSQIVNVLAEGIVCPSFLMSKDIVWDEVDEHHLKASIEINDIKISGVFKFDEDGKIIEFYTRDRYQDNNGIMIKRDWKAICNDYREVEGIKRPTSFKGIWIYPDHEKVYFSCDSVSVNFRYEY